MNAPPIASELVLVGGGHSHVHVLKMLGMPHYRNLLWQYGIRVTLIAKDIHTPYSGMLPGFVAGHYTYDDIHLDLQRICRFSNIRLIHASCTQVEYTNENAGTSASAGGLIHCNDGRPPLRYDALSIDIGSAPGATDRSIMYHPKIIPVKPIANFCRFYERLQKQFEEQQAKTMETKRQESSSFSSSSSKAHRICVVGGGAGGVELALSVQYNLQQVLRKQRHQSTKLQMVLVTRGSTLLAEHNAGVQRSMTRILKERNFELHLGCTVVGVVEKDEQSHLKMEADYEAILFDDCLWCTTAAGARWLSQKTPLECDERGFVNVDSTYQVQNHPGVFAAGDCAHMVDHPRPKAGVFAVRAGPPLLRNLMAYLTGLESLTPCIPQSTFLSIVSTGDPYAIASKGRYFSLEGGFVWKWKDWIDRAWMAKYTELPDMEEMRKQMHFRRDPNVRLNPKHRDPSVIEAFAGDVMRCGGCGAKVGSTTLFRVLKALHRRQVQRATKRNLPPPPPPDHDDAAITPLPTPSGGAMVHTIDYFRSIIDDPYVFGKIVAVHSLSDVHAMGATAQSALSLAVVPFAADEDITESTLLQLLTGVSDVLQDEGIHMIGGHTCEGTELACGVVVQGYAPDTKRLFRKRGGQVGDHIILTKPLGTGALFAADMRAKAKGEHVQEAIESMVRSNGAASRVATADRFTSAVRACTDVTGFGLIGHMLEMLQANDDTGNDEGGQQNSIGARIDIPKVPFLRGGLAASSQGIFSTLQPQNIRNRRAVHNHGDVLKRYPSEYPLLFDPQTAGGLMLFVDPKHSSQLLVEMKMQGVQGVVIGEVTSFQAATSSALQSSDVAETNPLVACEIVSSRIRVE